MHHPTDRITHTTAFCYTSRGALAGTRNSSMGAPHEGSIRRPIAPIPTFSRTDLNFIYTQVVNYVIMRRAVYFYYSHEAVETHYRHDSYCFSNLWPVLIAGQWSNSKNLRSPLWMHCEGLQMDRVFNEIEL